MKKVSQELVDMVVSQHEAQMSDNMGHLYNRFVGYISEAKVPLPNIITVLELLLHEALTLAKEKYGC